MFSQAGVDDPDATDSEGEDLATAYPAAVASGASAAAASGAANGDAGSSAPAPPQSIAAQLDALALQEDMLLQGYQDDMRDLDEVSDA